ncbi:MAG: hypothetical protein V4583_14940 [Pseudomonadota bacterium]
MSYMKGPRVSKFDRDPLVSSPLNAAISAQDRETLSMVAAALKDGRMRLAFPARRLCCRLVDHRLLRGLHPAFEPARPGDTGA